MDLNLITGNLWSLEHPIRMLPGVYIPARTTVLRKRDGALVVFSPLPRLCEAAEALRVLGPTDALVAPNLYHHLGLPEAIRCLAPRHVYGPASLHRKRADIAFTDALGPSAPAVWSADLEQLPLEGLKGVDEFAFFHRDSETLLLGDLAFNVPRPSGFASWLMLGLTGSWGPFGPSRLFKTTIVDRKALRRSVDVLLGWNPTRIVMAHGEVIQTGGRERLQAAFAFL